jgi:hypothetical protein
MGSQEQVEIATDFYSLRRQQDDLTQAAEAQARSGTTSLPLTNGLPTSMPTS